MSEISLSEAKSLISNRPVLVATSHETVRILGLEPNANRLTITSYEEAISLKPAGRLEFGKEYSAEEIQQIGVTIFYIRKI